MKYSEMSSIDVNRAVSKARLGSIVVYEIGNLPRGVDQSYQFCGSPGLAMPIMIEYKIGIAFVNGQWRASSVYSGYEEFGHANPLHAAMVVYLKIVGYEEEDYE